MQRPRSIVLFERCILGAWAIGVINTVSSWAHVRRDPRVVEAAQQIGAWYMPTVTIIGLLIPLALWYFIARRGSVVAKWIMVVITAIGLGTFAFAAFGSGVRAGLPGIFTVVGIALNLAASYLLFRPDTAAWFGERRDGEAA